MTRRAVYLTEGDVAELVDLNDAIDALEAGLRLAAKGDALDIPKALGSFEGPRSLHALGSAFPQDGLGGFKTWVNTPLGAAATLQLFDISQGRLRAIVEAGLLGQLRTAGISGVATRWMAAPDADELALIGTGRQALMQLAAVSVVRPLRRVRVFSPTVEKRAAFVAAASTRFSFAIEDHASLESAVAGAPIVTLVTRAREPFLRAELLADGAHVNAAGAILPASAEFHQSLFDRAGPVVVDSLAGVQSNSREFIDRYAPRGWDGVTPLSAIVDAPPARPSGDQISIFKAMGAGLSDLSVARLLLKRAEQRGAGALLPEPARATPRWRALEPLTL